MNEPLNTHRPVTIYISAAADVMAEREALGRIIAALPVTLAWRIVQTPLREELLELEAVAAADLYLLVMGSDIRAPIGLEWRMAQRSHPQTFAFLKQGQARTPAGQAFVRDLEVTWRPFSDAGDLSRQVERLLIERLLHHTARYALTPVEIEQLTTLRNTKTSQPAQGEGTGHSAIILSRERYMPGEGIIVNEA